MCSMGKTFCLVSEASAGGSNLFADSRSLSMHIESPCFEYLLNGPYVLLDPDASAESRIESTRTIWLGIGFLVYRDLSEPIRDNVFSLSYYGLCASAAGNRLFNNLMFQNVKVGYISGNSEVANCTFDSNDTGLVVSAAADKTVHMRDCLFTNNEDQGLWIYLGPGEVLNYYNAFWQNGTPVNGGSPGNGSQVLEESPYETETASDWQERYRLDQGSAVIDAGSCLAIDSPSYPNNRYTTRADGVCDLGIVDIGFHFYSFEDSDEDGMDDAWEEYFGLDPGVNDAGGDRDRDGVTNIEEYQQGLNPASKDTDGDGRQDPEVGEYDPLVPEFEKGPYLQNTHYVAGQGSAITVMCETPRNGKKGPEVRYRVPPGQWMVQERTAYRLIESPHYAHEIELTGLNSNSTYEYEVGYGFCYARGEPDPWTFLTAPSGAIPFRFVVYGDNRGDTSQPWGLYELQENHQAVVNGILTYSNPPENPIRFVLHSGDLVHDGGEYEQWQPQFFDPAWDLHKNIAIFEALGNHEWRTYAGQSGEAKYLAFFDLPEGYIPPDPEDKIENWYSFDWANCHFIVLDTKTNAPDDYIGPGTPQHNWLLTDISSGEATGADWVIVLLHIPPYTDAAPGEGHHYGSGDVYRVRTHLAGVFEDPAHPADLVFSGHNHFYERSQSTDDEQPGYYVHYIVTGGGGAPTHTPGYDNPERVDYPPYPGKAEETLHHCVIDINGTTATLNVVRDNGTYVEQNVILTPGQEWP